MAWLGEFQLQFYTTHFLTAGYDLDTISRMTPEVRSWPLTPSRPAPCLSRLRPPSTALKSAPHRPGWCHHDPPVSVTWPPGVSPEPQPVTPHTLSASFTYLCSHMAVCSSLCCKRYSLFVLECVFSAGVCVRVCLCMCLCIEADRWYDVNPLRAGDTHQRLSKAKYSWGHTTCCSCTNVKRAHKAAYI